jgi:hypothetical protein
MSFGRFAMWRSSSRPMRGHNAAPFSSMVFIFIPIYSRLFLSSLGGAMRHSRIVVCLATVSNLVFPTIHLRVSGLNIFHGFISCVIIRKIVEWLLDMDQQGDWRLEVAYFIAACEWTTGALPEQDGRQIHVGQPSRSQARYVTLHETRILFRID